MSRTVVITDKESTILARVEDALLKDHAATCVNTAIASGSAQDQREKFEELVDLVAKTRR